MAKALPSQPHIDWLKKAAKERLAGLRTRDASAKLYQAQLAVANDYGFPSWRALKARVDALSLDGQIIAAAKEGRARDLDGLLAQHPRKIIPAANGTGRCYISRPPKAILIASTSCCGEVSTSQPATSSTTRPHCIGPRNLAPSKWLGG